MKLGSLFDGAGTCPLAGSMCGVTPVWASEIEPFPVAVSSSNFPGMVHLGDITKVHGDQIEPVDILTFGSPCQDLSIAGKRAGLEGERSGLFMEAVRIIKEMRCATHGKYPPDRHLGERAGSLQLSQRRGFQDRPGRTLPDPRA